MRTIASIALLFAGAAAHAEVPKKLPASSFSHLHTNSPFTSKPPVDGGPVAPPPAFADWALGGVSEIEGGYMVTLVHKRNAGETQVIKPNGTLHSAGTEMKWIEPGARDGFKVEKVEFSKSDWKDTAVTVSLGGRSGQVKFDDKMLTPAVAAPPVQNRQQPGQRGQQQGDGNQMILPGQQPGVIQNQNQGAAQPRQRVVPPTNNAGQPQNNAQFQQSQQGQPNNRGQGNQQFNQGQFNQGQFNQGGRGQGGQGGRGQFNNQGQFNQGQFNQGGRNR